MKKRVLEIMNNYFASHEINNVLTLETFINRDSGFDSVGFMQIIIQIEEEFSIELDSYLDEIILCDRIRDLVEIVEKVVNR